MTADELVVTRSVGPGLRRVRAGRPDILRYQEVVGVADVLIRDVPDEVLAGIDAQAATLGLSRAEYIRRRLASDAARLTSQVTVDDLRTFAERHADLDDESLMRRAWT